MKTATLPSFRVEPALRVSQSEFVSRGLASLENAKHTGKYIGSDVVLGKLWCMLAVAESKRQSRQRCAIRCGSHTRPNVTLIEIGDSTQALVAAARHQLDDIYRSKHYLT